MAVTALGRAVPAEEVFGWARTPPPVPTIPSRTSNTTKKRWALFGLSIVETIVVAGLISTVLLFAMGLVPSFKFANRRAGMEIQASTLAQSALEAARSAKYSELAASISEVSLDGLTYEQEVQVTPDAADLTRSVRVIIRWSWQEKNYEIFRETVICRVPRG